MSPSGHETPTWTDIASAWRTLTIPDALDASALKKRVAAQTRRSRVWRVAELLVTAIAMRASWRSFERGRTSIADRVVAVDILVVLIVTWTVVWLGRAARSAPIGASTAVYVAVSRSRARQRIVTVCIALVLLVAQWYVASALLGGITPVSVLCSAAWVAWAAWEFRSVRQELEWLDAFDRDRAVSDLGDM
jgi:hypothetical protein